MAKKAIKKDNIPVIPEEIEMVAGKYQYTNMVRELFKKDPQVHMTFDDDNCIINMKVDDEIKALAIRRLLPEKKEIAKEIVTINVEFSGKQFGGPTYLKETVYQAFKGNPLFDYQYWFENPQVCKSPYCWVTMDKEPIFYPESNCHSVYGDTVKLLEELACNILNEITDYIFYCTSNPDREMPDSPNTRKFNE